MTTITAVNTNIAKAIVDAYPSRKNLNAAL
jgi:hypothetical protein